MEIIWEVFLWDRQKQTGKFGKLQVYMDFTTWSNNEFSRPFSYFWANAPADASRFFPLCGKLRNRNGHVKLSINIFFFRENRLVQILFHWKLFSLSTSFVPVLPTKFQKINKLNTNFYNKNSVTFPFSCFTLVPCLYELTVFTKTAKFLWNIFLDSYFQMFYFVFKLENIKKEKT